MFRAMEICKDFTQAFNEYAIKIHADDEDYYRRRESKSAILNFMVQGWWLIQEVGFDSPVRVDDAVVRYLRMFRRVLIIRLFSEIVGISGESHHAFPADYELLSCSVTRHYLISNVCASNLSLLSQLKARSVISLGISTVTRIDAVCI